MGDGAPAQTLSSGFPPVQEPEQQLVLEVQPCPCPSGTQATTGEAVGLIDGAPVGPGDGPAEGSPVGKTVGTKLGVSDAFFVGEAEGAKEAFAVGLALLLGG